MIHRSLIWNGNGSGMDFVTTFYVNRGPVPVVDEGLPLPILTIRPSSRLPRASPISKQASGSSCGRHQRVANIMASHVLIPLTGELKLEGVDSVANYQRVLHGNYDNILPEPILPSGGRLSFL